MTDDARNEDIPLPPTTDDDMRNADTLPPPATERTPPPDSEEETSPGGKTPMPEMDVARAVADHLFAPRIDRWFARIEAERAYGEKLRAEFIAEQQARDERRDTRVQRQIDDLTKLVETMTVNVNRILAHEGDEAVAHAEARRAEVRSLENERRIIGLEAQLAAQLDDLK